MTDETMDARLLPAPHDPEVQQRMARLHALGLGNQPDPEFDDFAAQLAHRAGTPYAMVNFIGEDQQYFAGLYAPSGAAATGALEAAQTATKTSISRVMERDHGYCPYVVVRRKALVLDDVCAYPRFAGNAVVDKIGISSYIGAPLIDETGTALGTICAVSTETNSWGRPGLVMIKSMATELMKIIQRRR